MPIRDALIIDKIDITIGDKIKVEAIKDKINMEKIEIDTEIMFRISFFSLICYFYNYTRALYFQEAFSIFDNWSFFIIFLKFKPYNTKDYFTGSKSVSDIKIE